MTSAINTNGINVNYPVPGVNNNSQGFRDNFATIRTNLNTASTEITDLQNNVVVKSALANTSINNDMANTLISNALTRSFRASTYNLGNNISNTITINASLGDVQYGTISGNTTIQFAGWAPSFTQSNVQLILNIANTDAGRQAIISFPSAVANSNTLSTLENFVPGTSNITIPYGVTELDYRLSTIDCGNLITIEPFNRPRIDTQIQQRTPAPTGFPGDVAGTVSVDANYAYVCTGSYNSIANTLNITATISSSDKVTIDNTAKVTANDPIILASNIGGLVANTVYYVVGIVNAGSPGNISVSATRTSGTAGANVTLTSNVGNVTATTYNGTDIWKRIALTSW
jgi:hypothetical protein